MVSISDERFLYVVCLLLFLTLALKKKKDGEPVVSKPGIHDPTKKQKKNIGYKTTRKRKRNEKKKDQLPHQTRRERRGDRSK